MDQLMAAFLQAQASSAQHQNNNSSQDANANNNNYKNSDDQTNKKNLIRYKMIKNLSKNLQILSLPVVIIGNYDKNNKPNSMTAA